jgi:hypothetical protein
MCGLSAAASVIAVVQICGQLFDICRTYSTSVKDVRKDITRLRDEITALESVLTSVADLEDTEVAAQRCGKTIMSSTILHHLTEMKTSNKMTLAYYFSHLTIHRSRVPKTVCPLLLLKSASP